jgi:hypothetical protein
LLLAAEPRGFKGSPPCLIVRRGLIAVTG